MYITPRDDCDNATYSHGTPDTNTRGSARYSFLPPSFPSSQARHELGQGFASKKIEVASLAIRSATPSIDFHTNCKLQLPFTPALPPYENDEMKSSINDITPPNMDSLSMKTRNMLMALQRPMEKEKTQKHQRKTVTFSDRPPLIYEIERCDALLMENSEGCADEEIASSSSSDERSSWDATLVENEPTHAVNKDESVSIKSPLASGQLEEKLNTTDSIAYASNLAIQRKGQRISRDEVLNLLAKRKEVQKIAGLQTQASRTPSFDIEKSQYQSMNTPLEEQILEAIRRAKLATASSYSGKEATHQDDLMRFKDTISKSKYDGPIYPATSSLPEATVLEHSENYDTHTHTTEDGCDPDDDENPVRNSVTSHSSDTFNSLVCSTPLDGEEQADNTTKISECENESDDEYNDCQEDFIEGNEGTSILAVSNPVSDFGKSLMSEIARITGDEIFATNPPNKQNIVVVSSEKPVITYEPSTCERNEVLAPENMPSSRSQLTSLKKLEPYHNNEGRLYIRVTAAENLDFPIDQDNHRIRCVLNYGTTHYTTEFQVMEHTIRFSHEFQIDTKKPITEFTLTLQISDNEKYEDARFKKIFAYRKRHHDVGIWRYANHTDGSICQSRVPIGEIVDKCILKVCNASFALVNGWYRQERTSILASRIKKKHLRHEKAVGKISAQFFFIPHTVSPKLSLLPKSMELCEDGMNIRRFHETIWQTGYMSQLGGDFKFWRRRYFRLQGGCIHSYSDSTRSSSSVIDLSRAVLLASELTILADTRSEIHHHSKDGTREVLHQLDRLADDKIIAADEPTKRKSGCSTHLLNDELSSFPVKNAFQLLFDSGKKIEFFCDSSQERERWLDVIKVMLGKIPEPPAWLNIQSHAT